jgi:hypothetical protein
VITRAVAIVIAAVVPAVMATAAVVVIIITRINGHATGRIVAGGFIARAAGRIVRLAAAPRIAARHTAAIMVPIGERIFIEN